MSGKIYVCCDIYIFKIWWFFSLDVTLTSAYSHVSKYYWNIVWLTKKPKYYKKHFYSCIYLFSLFIFCLLLILFCSFDYFHFSEGGGVTMCTCMRVALNIIIASYMSLYSYMVFQYRFRLKKTIFLKSLGWKNFAIQSWVLFTSICTEFSVKRFIKRLFPFLMLVHVVILDCVQICYLDGQSVGRLPSCDGRGRWLFTQSIFLSVWGIIPPRNF